MTAALIVFAYVIIGMITAFILVEYLKKKIGNGTSDGTFLIMYINVFFWPIFFLAMIHHIKKIGGRK